MSSPIIINFIIQLDIFSSKVYLSIDLDERRGHMRIDRESVRQLMLRQGIQTFSELAERLGVTKQTVSLWFGGGAFSSGSLEALCRELKCTPNDVLVFDDPNAMAPALEKVATV